jgi:asparagine synthase (glutamine-hydrolysing)
MCGIAGWIDRAADLTTQRPIIEAMTEPIVSRGPDDSGYFISPRAALGHRRLVIVDPAGGRQPMLRKAGGRTYVLIYNGELYNTADLRRALEPAGHRFAGHSDTEVLLASYIEWGPGCVERLNGIFAFGIWCEEEQQLFVARDRLGVKPLFFARRGTAFLFASELKALLAHPLIHPEIDAEGLAELFAIGPARTPGHGIFRAVHELKPGHALLLDAAGLRLYPYWRLQSQPHPDDLPATVEKVRWLLADAATRQLVSDVPLCTLLSGGIDSSALTAFAARAMAEAGHGQLHTWSVDYTENETYFRSHDFQPGADAPWVQRVSAALGTLHHSVLIDTPQLAGALVDAMRARDLPGMADIDASLLLFCREIKKGATVAISGECADEVFGGYPWFHRQEALQAETFPWSLQLGVRTAFLSPEVQELIRPEEYVGRRYREALDEVPRLPGEEAAAARIREMFWLNLFRWMPTLLDRKDRMSMAAGLEVRVPFCDHRLVEYLWNVPWAMKTAGGREKGLLRLALAGVLPDDVLQRRKSPYPKTHHPAYLAAVREALRDLLHDPSSPLLPLLDRPYVSSLLDSAEAASLSPWFGQLMGGPQLLAYLLQVDAWLREYRVAIK